MLFLKSSKPATLPDWLTAIPIAHRGLHDAQSGAEENSLTAFKNAMDAGLAIELDVHLSADLIPFVFHDATLSRMTADSRSIAEVSSAELHRLRLNGSHDTIPSLKEVLALVNGAVPLVIELKRSPIDNLLLAAKVWDCLKDYSGAFCIQSFDPNILKWFRLNAPNVIRGQLAMKHPPAHVSFFKKIMMRYLLTNFISRPHYIGYDVKDISYWVVKSALKHNMKLLAWTVQTEDHLAIAKKRADNIIFESLPVDHIR
ncbi:MAG: glycerophosphoryl diester phosphodiesterase [Sneathiella sp.]|jgi:glycerophosphoryl diester phosphodiesterase